VRDDGDNRGCQVVGGGARIAGAAEYHPRPDAKRPGMHSHAKRGNEADEADEAAGLPVRNTCVCIAMRDSGMRFWYVFFFPGNFDGI
jgi:hypothetical protein